ncbi:alkaline phosphatase 4-like [Bradysia coprophila]|uniref:alkaline phosphatase 4-like n=1 Tax=Bradysia coprophila TaxID=38358 RepID=UPI00187D97E7|nr:alkaline phosphatase 4-like [Bradysia coprophila]
MFRELLVSILLIKFGFSATFNTERVEDASYWRKHAETHLKKVLAQINTETTGNGIRSCAKNVIIFIGDGMGLSTVTAARIFKGQQKGTSGEEETLTFEEFPHTGLSKTYNVNKQVPDSAGTATALFTGVKTNYYVLGLDAVQSMKQEVDFNARLPSIMDWALAVNKRTGFVTTTRVTHATPAALYSHSVHRDWECDSKVPANMSARQDIARQLIENDPGRRINVIMAGGRKVMGLKETAQVTDQPKFNGSTETPCERLDGRNLIDEWMALHPMHKRKFISNTGELLSLNIEETDHLLGLFAQNHMSYSSVRDKSPLGEPSLAQMTKTAISLLKNNNTNGFVLMVEGGRIDQAHHQNHARLALQEVFEMDHAIQVALNDTSRSDTLIIVTADHSHAMTLNGYAARGNDILGFGNKPKVEPYETLTYANGPGFWRHRLNQSVEQQGKDGTWLRVNLLTNEDRTNPLYQHQAMFPLDDETHGGEDVGVYAIGPGAELLRGTFEQNYIAYVMSYAGCMGPVRELNVACNGSGSYNSAISLFSIVMLLIFHLIISKL